MKVASKNNNMYNKFMKIGKIKFYIILVALFGLVGLLFLAQPAQAFCPVCTIAVGAGVGLAQWLGIDDTISGVWVGGLIVALIMWAIDWLDKKGINFKFRTAIVSVIFYVVTVLPLYFTGIIGHPLNRILNMDKLIIGIIVGTVAFLAGVWIDSSISKDNSNKNYFPFQKVTITLVMLLFASFLFYLIVY